MILYHGSNVIVKQPRIIKDKGTKDFGFAFYLTSLKQQAEKLAKRKAHVFGGKPTISVFEWNENNTNLIVKNYPEANEEWLDMIVNCRSNKNFKHGYDIVIGKIADDTVGTTVGFVVEGVMKKEDAISRLKYQKINEQVAFCNDKAIKTLKFIKYYEVK